MGSPTPRSALGLKARRQLVEHLQGLLERPGQPRASPLDVVAVHLRRLCVSVSAIGGVG